MESGQGGEVWFYQNTIQCIEIQWILPRYFSEWYDVMWHVAILLLYFIKMYDCGRQTKLNLLPSYVCYSTNSSAIFSTCQLKKHLCVDRNDEMQAEWELRIMWRTEQQWFVHVSKCVYVCVRVCMHDGVYSLKSQCCLRFSRSITHTRCARVLI